MKRCIVSWSGGKDSSLVLHRLRTGHVDVPGGIAVEGLFTMFSPESGTSRSHGLPRGLLEAQAAAWDLPLHVAHAGWSDYEAVFKATLAELVEGGIEVAAFGDIFLDDHREWVERVCREVGCGALEPLWGEDTGELAREVLELGFRPVVCTLRSDRLEARWLGRDFDPAFLDHLEGRDVDPCGEHGEFHTVVVSGPGMDGGLVIDQARVEHSESHAHWVIERWRTSP